MVRAAWSPSSRTKLGHLGPNCSDRERNWRREDRKPDPRLFRVLRLGAFFLVVIESSLLNTPVQAKMTVAAGAQFLPFSAGGGYLVNSSFGLPTNVVEGLAIKLTPGVDFGFGFGPNVAFSEGIGGTFLTVFGLSGQLSYELGDLEIYGRGAGILSVVGADLYLGPLVSFPITGGIAINSSEDTSVFGEVTLFLPQTLDRWQMRRYSDTEGKPTTPVTIGGLGGQVGIRMMLF